MHIESQISFQHSEPYLSAIEEVLKEVFEINLEGFKDVIANASQLKPVSAELLVHSADGP